MTDLDLIPNILYGPCQKWFLSVEPGVSPKCDWAWTPPKNFETKFHINIVVCINFVSHFMYEVLQL